MGKAYLAVIILIMLAFTAAPACAAQCDAIRMDASQGYLRLDSDDAIVLTVHLLDRDGFPVRDPNVPVLLNFKSGEEFVIFEKQLAITNESGEGSAIVRLNAANQPERFRLPLMVMVEAVVIGNEKVRCTATVHVTSAGSVAGYVVNEDGSTITGANITARTPDGNVFPGMFRSSDGAQSPMGYYLIDNLPVGIGRHTLTASKNGFEGTLRAEAGYENIRQDIVIKDFVDNVDVTKIVTANTGSPTPSPTATPVPDTPAKPTSMTTTILIAIILITLVYLGLKAYRRMF
jgi:hypothetical protein